MALKKESFHQHCKMQEFKKGSYHVKSSAPHPPPPAPKKKNIYIYIYIQIFILGRSEVVGREGGGVVTFAHLGIGSFLHHHCFGYPQFDQGRQAL